MTTSHDILFKAIADPTRRRIIHLLSQSSLSVGELTASFAISQPAISQHLRELRTAHLVAAEKVGPERRYRLTGEPLREVYEWTRAYKSFFDPAGHVWAFTATALAEPARKGDKSNGR